MNKLKNQGSIKVVHYLLVCSFFLLAQSALFAQNGKDLFKANCAACHSVGSNKLVGPGLEGINDKRSEEWLIQWTKNSAELIASGDADAIAIFEEFNKIPMPPQNLSDEELVEVYAYIADPEGYSLEGEVTEEGVEEITGVNELGEKLYKSNCAACHSVGSNKVVGPGLEGVNDKRSKEWLIKWIQNSGELIASGDADANAIFEEYNKMIMPPQPLSEEEVVAVLDYIANPGTATAKTDDTEKEVVEEVNEEGYSITMYGVIIALLLLSFVVLVVVNKSKAKLEKAVAIKEGREFDGPTTLLESIKYTILKNKGFTAFVVVILIFLGLLDLMDGAFKIGVHEGYKPEQPIKFSHKVHAGDNKIDCNYCHSSARHSKTSGIPSLNVCMNCHKYVDGSHGKTFMYNGEEYSMEEEIKKIYTALDYDKETQTYGDNPQPVKWIKVHNLPDHVYYSHSQHVTVGNQECQTCHGPVEEMDVLEQHSPLTMGWCVECHRETGVSAKGNGYYEDMHARMSEEYKNKVLEDGKLTVDENGGLECAKCHY